MGIVRSDPRDMKANPPTMLAADGRTRLRRYRVDGVIYAPNMKVAVGRVQRDFYLDAATVKRA